MVRTPRLFTFSSSSFRRLVSGARGSSFQGKHITYSRRESLSLLLLLLYTEDLLWKNEWLRGVWLKTKTCSQSECQCFQCTQDRIHLNRVTMAHQPTTRLVFTLDLSNLAGTYSRQQLCILKPRTDIGNLWCHRLGKLRVTELRGSFWIPCVRSDLAEL